MSETGRGAGRHRRSAVLAGTLVVLLMGVAIDLYLGRGAAPPASALPLGGSMTELGSHAELDRVTANQGGPHQYFRDILVAGRKGESAQHLIRREVVVLNRGGWVYSGSVGRDRYLDAISVRAGTGGATSYAYNHSRRICATLQIYSDGDAALARFAANRHSRKLLWVTLSHDPGDITCSLPSLLH